MFYSNKFMKRMNFINHERVPQAYNILCFKRSLFLHFLLLLKRLSVFHLYNML